MPDSLPDVEARRSQLLLEIAQLGDFRRGSVHASFRRCGKPNCACASDDHPGHGPQVRLSYKLRGKMPWANRPPGAAAPEARQTRLHVNARRNDLEALNRLARPCTGLGRGCEELLEETEDAGPAAAVHLRQPHALRGAAAQAASQPARCGAPATALLSLPALLAGCGAARPRAFWLRRPIFDVILAA